MSNSNQSSPFRGYKPKDIPTENPLHAIDLESSILAGAFKMIVTQNP